jgi:hypothetical protein
MPCFNLLLFAFYPHVLGLSLQIVCLSEEDLLRCARIRQRLGLLGNPTADNSLPSSGQTEANALRYRNKILMKTVLSEKQVRVPVFASVQNQQDLIAFFREHGPKIGVGIRMGV